MACVDNDNNGSRNMTSKRKAQDGDRNYANNDGNSSTCWTLNKDVNLTDEQMRLMSMMMKKKGNSNEFHHRRRADDTAAVAVKGANPLKQLQKLVHSPFLQPSPLIAENDGTFVTQSHFDTNQPNVIADSVSITAVTTIANSKLDSSSDKDVSAALPGYIPKELSIIPCGQRSTDYNSSSSRKSKNTNVDPKLGTTIQMPSLNETMLASLSEFLMQSAPAKTYPSSTMRSSVRTTSKRKPTKNTMAKVIAVSKQQMLPNSKRNVTTDNNLIYLSDIGSRNMTTADCKRLNQMAAGTNMTSSLRIPPTLTVIPKAGNWKLPSATTILRSPPPMVPIERITNLKKSPPPIIQQQATITTSSATNPLIDRLKRLGTDIEIERHTVPAVNVTAITTTSTTVVSGNNYSESSRRQQSLRDLYVRCPTTTTIDQSSQLKKYHRDIITNNKNITLTKLQPPPPALIPIQNCSSVQLKANFKSNKHLKMNPSFNNSLSNNTNDRSEGYLAAGIDSAEDDDDYCIMDKLEVTWGGSDSVSQHSELEEPLCNLVRYGDSTDSPCKDQVTIVSVPATPSNQNDNSQHREKSPRPPLSHYRSLLPLPAIVTRKLLSSSIAPSKIMDSGSSSGGGSCMIKNPPINQLYFSFPEQLAIQCTTALPNGQKIYKCDICPEIHYKLYLLRKHYIRCHINYKYIHHKDASRYSIPLVQIIKSTFRDKTSDSGDDKSNKWFSDLYRCNLCDGRFFDDKFELKEHVTKHRLSGANEKSYDCPNCRTVFLKNEQFLNHLMACKSNMPAADETQPVTKLEKLQVVSDTNELPELIMSDKLSGLTSEIAKPSCGLSEDIAAAASSPVDAESIEKQSHDKLLCLFCDETFANVLARKRHNLRVHHPKKKSHKCHYCNVTANLNDLFKHMCNSHKKKYVGCIACKCRFSSTNSLTSHMRDSIAHNNSIVRLNKMKNIPQKLQASMSLMTIKKTTCKRPRTFKCTECPLIFSSNIKMGRHRRTEHRSTILNIKPKQQTSPLACLPPLPLVQFVQCDMNEMVATGIGSRQMSETTSFISFLRNIDKMVKINLLYFMGESMNSQQPDEYKQIHCNNSLEAIYDSIYVDNKRIKTSPICLASNFNSIPVKLSDDWQKDYDALFNPRRTLNFIDLYGSHNYNDAFISNISILEFTTQLTILRKIRKFQAEQNVPNNDAAAIIMTVDPLNHSSVNSKFDIFWPSSSVREPVEDEQLFLRDVEFGGEFSYPHRYICVACHAHFHKLRDFQDHCLSKHPNVMCINYTFPIDQTPGFNWGMKHTLAAVGMLGSSACGFLKGRRSAVNSGSGDDSTSYYCTKCDKTTTPFLSEFHKHILECGGDTTWATTMLPSSTQRKNRRYNKPFGSRRRSTEARVRGLKRTIQTPKKLVAHQSSCTVVQSQYARHIKKAGDAETIQRMIANLPPKRITRRAIMFDELTVPPARQLKKKRKAIDSSSADSHNGETAKSNSSFFSKVAEPTQPPLKRKRGRKPLSKKPLTISDDKLLASVANSTTIIADEQTEESNHQSSDKSDHSENESVISGEAVNENNSVHSGDLCQSIKQEIFGCSMADFKETIDDNERIIVANLEVEPNNDDLVMEKNEEEQRLTNVKQEENSRLHDDSNGSNINCRCCIMCDTVLESPNFSGGNVCTRCDKQKCAILKGMSPVNPKIFRNPKSNNATIGGIQKNDVAAKSLLVSENKNGKTLCTGCDRWFVNTTNSNGGTCCVECSAKLLEFHKWTKVNSFNATAGRATEPKAVPNSAASFLEKSSICKDVKLEEIPAIPTAILYPSSPIADKDCSSIENQLSELLPISISSDLVKSEPIYCDVATEITSPDWELSSVTHCQSNNNQIMAGNDSSKLMPKANNNVPNFELLTLQIDNNTTTTAEESSLAAANANNSINCSSSTLPVENNNSQLLVSSNMNLPLPVCEVRSSASTSANSNKSRKRRHTITCAICRRKFVGCRVEQFCLDCIPSLADNNNAGQCTSSNNNNNNGSRAASKLDSRSRKKKSKKTTSKIATAAVKTQPQLPNVVTNIAQILSFCNACFSIFENPEMQRFNCDSCVQLPDSNGKPTAVANDKVVKIFKIMLICNDCGDKYEDYELDKRLCHRCLNALPPSKRSCSRFLSKQFVCKLKNKWSWKLKWPNKGDPTPIQRQPLVTLDFMNCAICGGKFVALSTAKPFCYSCKSDPNFQVNCLKFVASAGKQEEQTTDGAAEEIKSEEAGPSDSGPGPALIIREDCDDCFNIFESDSVIWRKICSNCARSVTQGEDHLNRLLLLNSDGRPVSADSDMKIKSYVGRCMQCAAVQFTNVFSDNKLCCNCTPYLRNSDNPSSGYTIETTTQSEVYLPPVQNTITKCNKFTNIFNNWMQRFSPSSPIAAVVEDDNDFTNNTAVKEEEEEEDVHSNNSEIIVIDDHTVPTNDNLNNDMDKRNLVVVGETSEPSSTDIATVSLDADILKTSDTKSVISGSDGGFIIDENKVHLTCKACNMIFSTVSGYQQHGETCKARHLVISHKKRNEQNKAGNSSGILAAVQEISSTVQWFADNSGDTAQTIIPVAATISSPSSTLSEISLICQPCNLPFTSVSTYKQHRDQCKNLVDGAPPVTPAENDITSQDSLTNPESACHSVIAASMLTSMQSSSQSITNILTISNNNGGASSNDGSLVSCSPAIIVCKDLTVSPSPDSYSPIPLSVLPTLDTTTTTTSSSSDGGNKHVAPYAASIIGPISSIESIEQTIEDVIKKFNCQDDDNDQVATACTSRNMQNTIGTNDQIITEQVQTSADVILQQLLKHESVENLQSKTADDCWEITADNNTNSNSNNNNNLHGDTTTLLSSDLIKTLQSTSSSNNNNTMECASLKMKLKRSVNNNELVAIDEKPSHLTSTPKRSKIATTNSGFIRRQKKSERTVKISRNMKPVAKRPRKVLLLKVDSNLAKIDNDVIVATMAISNPNNNNLVNNNINDESEKEKIPKKRTRRSNFSMLYDNLRTEERAHILSHNHHQRNNDNNDDDDQQQSAAATVLSNDNNLTEKPPLLTSRKSERIKSLSLLSTTKLKTDEMSNDDKDADPAVTTIIAKNQQQPAGQSMKRKRRPNNNSSNKLIATSTLERQIDPVENDTNSIVMGNGLPVKCVMLKRAPKRRKQLLVVSNDNADLECGDSRAEQSLSNNNKSANAVEMAAEVTGDVVIGQQLTPISSLLTSSNLLNYSESALALLKPPTLVSSKPGRRRKELNLDSDTILAVAETVKNRLAQLKANNNSNNPNNKNDMLVVVKHSHRRRRHTILKTIPKRNKQEDNRAKKSKPVTKTTAAAVDDNNQPSPMVKRASTCGHRRCRKLSLNNSDSANAESAAERSSSPLGIISMSTRMEENGQLLSKGELLDDRMLKKSSELSESSSSMVINVGGGSNSNGVVQSSIKRRNNRSLLKTVASVSTMAANSDCSNDIKQTIDNAAKTIYTSIENDGPIVAPAAAAAPVTDSKNHRLIGNDDRATSADFCSQDVVDDRNAKIRKRSLRLSKNRRTSGQSQILSNPDVKGNLVASTTKSRQDSKCDVSDNILSNLLNEMLSSPNATKQIGKNLALRRALTVLKATKICSSQDAPSCSSSGKPEFVVANAAQQQLNGSDTSSSVDNAMTVYSCPMCNVRFDNSCEQKEHVIVSHGTVPFSISGQPFVLAASECLPSIGTPFLSQSADNNDITCAADGLDAAAVNDPINDDSNDWLTPGKATSTTRRVSKRRRTTEAAVAAATITNRMK